MKKGPANIPIEIEAAVASSTKYSDSSFSPDDRSLSYKRWTEVSGFKSNTIFDQETVHFSEANQGSLGNCYFINSIAAAAEYPNLITDMFVTGMNENDAGIYGIRFFIRGKPWIVTIDNKMPFKYSVFNGYSLRGVK